MEQVEKARPLSCRGDQAFIDAVNHIARRRGKHTADFVKEMLVEKLGDELTEVRNFFAADGRKYDQTVEEMEDQRATA